MLMNAEHLCHYARVCVQRKGLQVRDMEYASAIGYGVAQAMAEWYPGHPRSLKHLAADYAWRECKRVHREYRRFVPRRERVAEGVMEEVPAYQPEPVDTLIAAEVKVTARRKRQLVILGFCAANGVVSAAKQLKMSPASLREMLDEIRAEVEQEQG